MKFRKKVYGESKLDYCPFCGRMATQKNDAGLLVCYQHLKQKLEEIRCSCGSWLEQRAGKFGPYFNCLRCGNINFKKGMEMKGLMSVKKIEVKSEVNAGLKAEVKANAEIRKESFENKKQFEYERPLKREQKEIFISTNDVEYFD